MIRLGETYISVMYDYLHKLIYDYHVIQADETPDVYKRQPVMLYRYIWHLVLKHRLEHIVLHRLFSLRCRKRYYVVNHAYAKCFTIYNLFLLKQAFTSVFTYTSIISQTAFFFKNILSGIYFFIFLVIEIWSDACIPVSYTHLDVYKRQHAIHAKSCGWLHIFLRNILYAAPVNTVSKCEAHKTHYFI